VCVCVCVCVCVSGGVRLCSTLLLNEHRPHLIEDEPLREFKIRNLRDGEPKVTQIGVVAKERAPKHDVFSYSSQVEWLCRAGVPVWGCVCVCVCVCVSVCTSKSSRVIASVECDGVCTIRDSAHALKRVCQSQTKWDRYVNYTYYTKGGHPLTQTEVSKPEL
jgi:hypothetical protein